MLRSCALYRCPDELLLQIFELLNGEDLLSVTGTSRRLRGVSLDNSLWWPICQRIVSICAKLDPGETLPVSQIDLSLWGAESYFEIYTGLRRWEPYLGWWIPAGPRPEQVIMRCVIDKRGIIYTEPITISQDFDDRLRLIPGTQLAHFHWGIHIIVRDILGNPMSVGVQDISYVIDQGASSNWRMRTRDEYGGFLAPSHGSWAPWKIYAPKPLNKLPELFPSPSMLPALRGATLSEAGNLICASYYQAFDQSPNYLPIHTPYSTAWDRSLRNPVDSGLYVASYGAHGTELLSVTFRLLNEADFEWQHNVGPRDGLPYPWDCHLSGNDPRRHFGPFRPRAQSCGNVHAKDLRAGQRIMEVTKLTGDPNVPRGQRSLLAFLDIASPDATSYDMAQANRVNLGLESNFDGRMSVLPRTSTRPAVAPWPILFDENGPVVPARMMTPDEMMKPGAGWTVSGIGRISQPGFRSPGWGPAVFHFASREEFQAMWLGMVMTFTRLN